MAMVSSFFGIGRDEFTKLFEITIQMGAILAMVVLYWRKFLNITGWKFYARLIIGVIPSLVAGYFLADTIDLLLGSPTYIALFIFAGGVALLFLDDVFRKPRIKTESEITFLNAFLIGCFQCAAVVMPGLSRSAATIIGGMQQKLTRGVATEFAFFLAVPTMAAATGKKLYDIYKDNPQVLQDHDNQKLLILGCVIAFIVAMATINLFISFIKKYGFKFFGWYRIILAMVFFLMIKMYQIR